MMYVRIFSDTKVTTKEERFDTLEKSRVGGHHIGKLAMLRASLAHDDAAIFFQNLCFDFAGMLVHQRLERCLARDHSVANFLNATRTEDVGLSWEPKRRRGTFVGFQKRPRRPFWPHTFAFGQQGIDRLERFPGDVRKVRNQFRALRSAELTSI